MVQEENGLPHQLKVLVSKVLGQDKLVVDLEYRNDIGILHKKFPKTLPEKPTYSQGKELRQAIASGGRPVEGVIQSKEGWQRLKEEPPDRQGKSPSRPSHLGADQGRKPSRAGRKGSN